MSDFLARLAERALGQVPSVQPLLVSRFAPVSSPSAFAASTEGKRDGAIGPETDRAVPTLPHLPGSISSPPPQEASPELGMEASRAPGGRPGFRENSEGPLAAPNGRRFVAGAPIQSTPAANSHARGESEADARGLYASAQNEQKSAIDSGVARVSAVSEATGDRPSKTGQPSPIPPVPFRDHAQEGAQTAAESGLPLAANGGFASGREARDLNEGNRPDSTESVAPRLIASQSRQRPATGGSTGRVAARSAHDDGRPGAETMLRPTALSADLTPPIPQAEAAPVIRVTIGRIEVRAIMMPAPAAKAAAPARPAPVLSLDDYLKRGHGERP